MTIGAPQVVEAQPRVGLPFGLFSVLTFRPDSQGREVAGGIEWRSMPCGPVSAVEDPSCDTFGTDPGQIEKEFPGSLDIGEATPFLVYGTDKCGTPGGRAFDEGVENATAHLLAREEAQAESAMWRRFARAATDLNAAGAVSPAEGLAALEKWMGTQYGSLGAMHMERDVASLLDQRLTPTGSRLITRLGTPVVAGAGYPGTSPTTEGDPDGTPNAAGVSWMFAAPALFGYRGQVFSSSALDTKMNDHYALAERQYVVGFDPCGVGAVRVDLTA